MENRNGIKEKKRYRLQKAWSEVLCVESFVTIIGMTDRTEVSAGMRKRNRKRENENV